MFIREYKTKNKKTGADYVTHKLVESVRTEKGPRQRIVMSLGTLDIPRVDWKRLAHALECRITGQETLLDEHDIDLERLALSLVASNKLSKRLASSSHDTGDAINDSSERRYDRIDLDSVRTKESRSIGAELLCWKAWEMLGFADILKALRFSPKRIAATMALLFGRMISPGSERHTIDWFRNRSALSEFPGVVDISRSRNDLFYEVGDDLYDSKDYIEDRLFSRERTLFPHDEATIFLYDITNTYLEGGALGNRLAARGHCKSKRYDCPLLTLALVVDNDGMPIVSQVYRGNQSEPETMEAIMRRLALRLNGSQLSYISPTVVMDRGIATMDNIAWLRDNGYHYIVVSREDQVSAYREQFASGRETFELISSKRSIYGEDSSVYIRKEHVPQTEDGVEALCRVLCISEGRVRKERAIDARKEQAFLLDIARFRRSIEKGNIKKLDKIEAKLKRILSKHAREASAYEAAIDIHDGKAVGITLISKEETEEQKLYGCYVIESTHTDCSAAEIWKLYMTLSRVESAFRSLKETLGVRPVYHQKGERAAAHLFISVLAYHMLATIENLMTRKGDCRTWGTIREVMSNMMRVTVTMQNDAGATYHIRTTNLPDACHQDILDKLGIRPHLNQVISKIG